MSINLPIQLWKYYTNSTVDKKSISQIVNKRGLKNYFGENWKLSWPYLPALSSHTVFVAILNDQSAATWRAKKAKWTRARAHFLRFFNFLRNFTETYKAHWSLVFCYIYFYKMSELSRNSSFDKKILYEACPAEGELWL